jgi:tRNA pseudouridine38-40 synthase
MKILLKVAYLGTAYCGFQVQKNGISIQQVLQDAVEKVFGERFALTGCSRTDSGVHARAFYCTVAAGDACNRLPIGAVAQALNCNLPRDVSVLEASLVPDTFHPRYDVICKEYRYHIWNRREKNPFLFDRAWHYPRALDIEKMNLAAKVLIGRHDFSGFMSAGSSVTDTVRTVSDCRVESDREGNVYISVCADGFLYNMVRIIVGTLVAVSEGKRAVEEMEAVLASQDRSRAGSTAPACGHYLNRVEYPPEVF